MNDPTENPQHAPSSAADQTAETPLADVTMASEVTDADVLSLAPRLRNYRVTGTLGRGGMGVVWRAEQISTHRAVALKVMSASSFGSERRRLRFERENMRDVIRFVNVLAHLA